MQSTLSSWMRGAAVSAGVALAVAMAPGAAMAVPTGTFTIGTGNSSVNSGTGNIAADETILTVNAATNPGTFTLNIGTIGTFTGLNTQIPTLGYAPGPLSSTSIALVIPPSPEVLAAPLLVDVGPYAFTFTTAEVSQFVATPPSGNGNLGLLWNGTVTGDTTTGSPNLGGSIQMSMSLTQTGQGGTITGNFSLQAPISNTITTPEPASVAVLAVGLLGLVMVSRRRA